MESNTARVLIENPTEEQFAAIRRDLVTGTDIATIMGLNPYSSSYNLALEKKGKLPARELNDAMWIGKQLEPTILALFERKMGKKVRPNRAVWCATMPGREWIGGTPDAFTETVPVEGVEAKAVGINSHRDWGEPGTEEVPAFYWTQAQWYAGLFQIDWNLMAMIGTKGQNHPIPRQHDVYSKMVDAAREFREKYLLTDALPEPSASDIQTVAKLFPKSEEAELMETPEIRPLIDALARAKADGAAAELAEKAAKAKLMALMGEKQRLRGEDFSISWKNNKDSVKVDLEAAFDKALIRLPNKYAEELQKIIAEFTKTVPGARVFRTSGALFRGAD